MGRSTTMYIGVTIVGSKGYWNYIPSALDAPTQVDRDKIMCIPIEIRNILDVQQVEEGIGNCIRATKYSLGIKNQLSRNITASEEFPFASKIVIV